MTEQAIVQGDLKINTGIEDDLFDGEVLEITLAALNRSLPTCHEKSRSWDILTSINGANKSDNIPESKARELKQAMGVPFYDS
ncbi:hypothetical protein [Serratia proteamaculans]